MKTSRNLNARIAEHLLYGRVLGTLAILASIAFPSQSWATDVVDEFKNGLKASIWDTCQIDMKRLPVTFDPDPADPNDKIAHITVDEGSLGGLNCHAILPSEAKTGLPEERLGPSLLSFAGRKWMPGVDKPDPYCTDAIRKQAKKMGEGKCIQRQEIRLQEALQQRAKDPTNYAFRFRMPAKLLNTTDSIRWVVGQWKSEPVSNADPSPFLAQRYDDGILNITMQDGSCRCLVASAPLLDGTTYAWNDGQAKYCQSTADADESKLCDAHIDITYGKNPTLTSPAGQWVEMGYRVQAGP